MHLLVDGDCARRDPGHAVGAEDGVEEARVRIGVLRLHCGVEQERLADVSNTGCVLVVQGMLVLAREVALQVRADAGSCL